MDSHNERVLENLWEDKNVNQLGPISEATVKIRAINPRIFWIGNGGTPKSGDIVIPGSNCDDEITSTIVDAIVLQRFAMEFSVASGFNPDVPAGLSKVTLTN